MSTYIRNKASLGLEMLIVVVLCAACGYGLTQENAPPLTPLTQEGDPARGERLAATCAGCHGVPGYRNAYPSYHVPKLGGQNADYIEIALLGYRRGTRPHETMQAQAASLNNQDIADLSAYFASFEDEQRPGISGGSKAEIRAGREKAAACVACHGATGVAQGEQWPNLAGQHASYLEQALTQYKLGTRENMIMGPMVSGLDEQTIEQLAAYFAAQPGLYTTDDL